MSAQVAALRSLLEQRFPDAVQIAQHTADRMATGIAQLDRALPGGGFPLGRLTVWEPGGGASRLPSCRAACSTAVGQWRPRGVDRCRRNDRAEGVLGEEGSPLLVRPSGAAMRALRAPWMNCSAQAGSAWWCSRSERDSASITPFFRDVDLVRLKFAFRARRRQCVCRAHTTLDHGRVAHRRTHRARSIPMEPRSVR